MGSICQCVSILKQGERKNKKQLTKKLPRGQNGVCVRKNIQKGYCFVFAWISQALLSPCSMLPSQCSQETLPEMSQLFCTREIL